MGELSDLLRLLTSGEDEQAERAAIKMAAYGEDGLAALRALIADKNPDKRWWAARALAEIDDEQVVPLLVQALGDTQPAVRQCAARGLQQHPDERSIEALAAALADDDSLVVRLSANALAAAGSLAVPTLLEILKKGDSKTQLEAMRALALIGDQSTIPALFEALDSDSTLLEYWANEGLERMGVGMMFFKP